jgi:Flp pilus assembly protein TadG
LLTRLFKDKRGSVAVIGGLALTSMIGASALVVELGQGYLAKTDNQRVADMAALAAAIAYSKDNSTDLDARAKEVALANGYTSSSVSAAKTTLNGADVVRATVVTSVSVQLARVLGFGASYDVTSVASASLPSAPSAPGCIIALDSSGSGIKMSGGTTINATNCAVTSNSSISMANGPKLNASLVASATSLSVSGGSVLTATSTTYGTTKYVENGSSINGANAKKSSSAADPLASNADLLAAMAAASGACGTKPDVPTIPVGDDLKPNYYPTTMTFQGKTATLNNGTWTFPLGTYNIRDLDTSSLKLLFTNGSTVTISRTLTVGGGGGLTIGDGPVSITAPIALAGGTFIKIGDGRHYIGQVSMPNGGGSTLTIGKGDLDVNGSISLAGGVIMTIGAGNYKIGNSSGSTTCSGTQTALDISGGSKLTFGDGAFSTMGDVKNSGGGTTIVFGATLNHIIGGDLNLQGDATFGAGRYTIRKGFSNPTGGTMTGTDVTFIMGGTLAVSGGTSVRLSAPTTTTAGGGFADVLFASSLTSATALTEGASTTFRGAIYLPNSDFTMSGGASIGSSCFMMIAKSITLQNGTSAAQADGCSIKSTASGGGGNVALVQ